MLRQWVCSMCVSVLICAVGVAQVADDFSTAQDYLADGVSGSVWDGFLGLGENETASAINSSMARDGQLYLEATGGDYEGLSELGPFLYVNVSGNFVATVKVADYAGDVNAPVDHLECGLMARVGDLDAGGPGEDFVSTCYFPRWVGNRARSTDDGGVQNPYGAGAAWNAKPYLQLERNRNTFYYRISDDGVTWDDMGSVERADLAGLPMQVGMWMCTYSSIQGYVAFDDFSVETFVEHTASPVYPEDGATMVDGSEMILEWTPGDDAMMHEVYMGTDPNTLEFVDLISETTLSLGALENDVTYYWTVKELSLTGIYHASPVWSFTTGTPQSLFPLISTVQDFNEPHDFLVDGVEGTIWDGVIGLAEGEIANAINASMDRESQLYLESGGARWEPVFTTLGPFIYRTVKGDFVASVKVTDYAGDANAPVDHLECGLMARIGDLDAAGDGEDFVMNNYFPRWVGNRGRSTDDGELVNLAASGSAWNAVPYLQLERAGNVFYLRTSEDGETWTDLDSVERADMNDLPVQVGLWQCTYIDDVGYAAFDDFSLECAPVNDEFDVPHDYVAEGVEGTFYDGLIGLAEGETVNAANASVDREGQLYIESGGARWEPVFTTLGPFLYRMVEGDFIATVEVAEYAGDVNAPVDHLECGLMARVADLDVAGEGEDFVMNNYFPRWVGNRGRSTDDGELVNLAASGAAWNAVPYLQLERQGNTFILRTSEDGEVWTDLDTVEREDLDGLALQVGVWQCTYIDDIGYVSFDNLSIVAK